jgi:hypothetical protein
MRRCRPCRWPSSQHPPGERVPNDRQPQRPCAMGMRDRSPHPQPVGELDLGVLEQLLCQWPLRSPHSRDRRGHLPGVSRGHSHHSASASSSGVLASRWAILSDLRQHEAATRRGSSSCNAARSRHHAGRQIKSDQITISMRTRNARTLSRRCHDAVRGSRREVDNPTTPLP